MGPYAISKQPKNVYSVIISFIFCSKKKKARSSSVIKGKVILQAAQRLLNFIYMSEEEQGSFKLRTPRKCLQNLLLFLLILSQAAQ